MCPLFGSASQRIWGIRSDTCLSGYRSGYNFPWHEEVQLDSFGTVYNKLLCTVSCRKPSLHKVKESQELSDKNTCLFFFFCYFPFHFIIFFILFKNTFLPMLFDLTGLYSHSYGVHDQHDEIIRLVLTQFFLSFLFEELTFMYICNTYLSPTFFNI